MTKYVSVNWNASKARKQAQAEYEKIYALLRKADGNRKAVVAQEMSKAGHIPRGMEPNWKTRPWDGQLQVTKDDAGAFEYQLPKAQRKGSKDGETV